ncbi:MAG: ABC transporter substrate-binding protein [Spirochaetales bacterium]
MRNYSRAVNVALLALVLGVAPIAATGVQEEDQVSPGAEVTVEALLHGAGEVTEASAHASGFRVFTVDSLTLLQVTRPWPAAGESDMLTYVLYDRDDQRPNVTGASLVIPTPVESVVTMSTTFLAHLEALEQLDSLDAVDNLAFAYSERVRELSGELAQVGSGPSVDTEQLVAIDPDAILVNSFGGDWDSQPTLEAAGLPAVVLGDWVETTPLGRANWLVFTAYLYGEEASAIARMNRLADNYNRLAELGRSAEEKPTVLINAPFQGTWSIAGGGSYAATFIRDAGGNYVYGNDTSTGALFFDLESVYAEAGEADVWINTGTWGSLAQAEAEDERYADFAAFASGRLFNNNQRMSAAGGNDYFESGAINPDVVLADLIKIFHPDLLPDHELFYYQQLQ